MSEQPTLYVLVGLPGAGKTTYYQKRLASCVHVSKDLLKGNKQVKMLAAILIAMRAGKDVVVDNTNVTVLDRKPLRELADQHGYQKVAIYFDVTTKTAIERNAQREGTACVPPVAIYTRAKRLEQPTTKEGFDEVYWVQPGMLANDEIFKVS